MSKKGIIKPTNGVTKLYVDFKRLPLVGKLRIQRQLLENERGLHG